MGRVAIFAVVVLLDPERSQPETAKRGGTEVAKSGASLEAGRWHGPVLAGYGVHLVYVEARSAAVPAEFAAVRDDLPILLVAGDQDPINRGMAGLRLLEERYRAAGVTQLDTQYYAGGRHEMLNETNRDEVTANLVSWIVRTVEAGDG